MIKDGVRYFHVGTVANTHGIRGGVKVAPTTDDPKRFNQLKTVLAEGDILLTIKSVAHMRTTVLIYFEGCDDMSAAEKLKGKKLYFKESDAPPLEDGEYYILDLIGLRVVTEDGEALGVISDVLQTGANDVYFVSPSEGGKDILIPAIKQCVLDIDIKGGAMTVRLLDGLVS